jgi:lysophospholipase L1-like esterase
MRILKYALLLACVPITAGVAQTQPPAQAAPAQVQPTPAQPAQVQGAQAQGAPKREPITIPGNQGWKLTDWAQLSRFHDANQTVGPTVPGRVIFYGDSITIGWHLADSFPGKPYINRGISGQTTQQMVVRFRQDVIDLHPAAVVILAGTNDIAGNTGPETPEMIEDSFKSMVDLAKANGIRVILSSITPVADYPWKPGLKPIPTIQALNSWMAGYCVTHDLTYLDYFTAMADENGGMKPGISIEGVHPTAPGYAIMAPLAQAAINKAIGKQ